MQVLLDTNVVLDVLLSRDPWVVEASALWQAHDHGTILGFLAASAMTDIFYIARRLVGIGLAHKAVHICPETFEICAVNRQALELAETLPGNDFEDNLLIACATIAGLDAIVTRDTGDFKDTSIPVLTPMELLAQLGIK